MASFALVARSTLTAVGIVASFGCGSTTFIIVDTQDGAASDAPGSESGDSASETPPSDAPCKRTHPLVDAGLRFCGPGDCYCMDTDACYAKASAAGCCAGAVKCTE